MMNRNIYIAIATIFLFSSCVKEVEFDAEVKQPKLAINSYFTPDSSWKVHIGNSLSVIDNQDPQNIENATVNVYDASNNWVATLTHDMYGIYSSSSTYPQAGQSYRIEAAATNYTNVTAQDVAPNAVPILSIDTASVVYDGDDALEVQVNFQDPSSTDNHYVIQVFGYDLNERRRIDFGMNDIILNDDGNSGYDRSFTFTDDLINDQSHTLDLYIDHYYTDPMYSDFDSLEVELISASYAFYQYGRTYKLWRRSSDDPFSQPVQVYSNVDAGHGIFAGYSKDAGVFWRE
jgi:hypothetical protein